MAAIERSVIGSTGVVYEEMDEKAPAAGNLFSNPKSLNAVMSLRQMRNRSMPELSGSELAEFVART